MELRANDISLDGADRGVRQFLDVRANDMSLDGADSGAEQSSGFQKAEGRAAQPNLQPAGLVPQLAEITAPVNLVASAPASEAVWSLAQTSAGSESIWNLVEAHDAVTLESAPAVPRTKSLPAAPPEPRAVSLPPAPRTAAEPEPASKP